MEAILCEKSETRVMGLFDKLELKDFWISYSFLTQKVGLSEIQAFSICVRKFGEVAAFDPEVYSYVRYTYYSDWTSYGGPPQLSLIFEKKEHIPHHLHRIYGIMSEVADKFSVKLSTHLSRLQYGMVKQYSVVVEDIFVAHTILTLGGATATEENFRGWVFERSGVLTSKVLNKRD